MYRMCWVACSAICKKKFEVSNTGYGPIYFALYVDMFNLIVKT